MIDWVKLTGWVLAMLFCTAWWAVVLSLILYAAE